MQSWRAQLRIDPLPYLLSSNNQAIHYFVKRDILDEHVEPRETIWQLPAAQKLLSRQQPDGSWKYPGGGKPHLRSHENYNMLETYRILGELVEKYGFTTSHPSIQKAADFLFQFQTNEGDFRGIYGPQYATTYSSAIMELLIKTGYHRDPRIEQGFRWLLSCKQNDGGWAIPLRTVKMNYYEAMRTPHPVQPDRSKPFSHLVTGIVLRAFAAHPTYRKTKEAQQAGVLLASRLFKPDPYPDRNTMNYWMSVSFPFWFTDVVSALDSLSLLGFHCNEPSISSSLDWLRKRQNDNGLFNVKLLKGKDKDLPVWICFATCRIFRRFYRD